MSEIVYIRGKRILFSGPVADLEFLADPTFPTTEELVLELLITISLGYK